MIVLLVLVQEDVEHGQVGEGVAFAAGLHPGDISLSLQELVGPRPKA